MNTEIDAELIDKIINIDCMDGFKQLPDKSVNCIIADPPYGISRHINTKGKRIGRTAKLDFDFGEWDKFNKEWIEEGIKKTKGWFISFCAKKDIGIYWNLLEENKFVAVDSVAWIKPDPLPFNAKSRFVNAWESLVVGKRPSSYWGSSYFPNILKYQAPKNKKRVHPTQKPLKLIMKLVELTTEPGDIVLDPFIGSGTTAIASKLLGRRFIGFEKSKEHHTMALKVLEENSGKRLDDFNF